MTAAEPTISRSSVASLVEGLRAATPALLFGLRLWASVCLSLYVAFALELSEPSWAATTAALVCTPVLGASLRKASFRMVGTAVGAVAIVILAAAVRQDRVGFLVGLAVWCSICVFVATLLRNFAAYAAALSGYTAAILASDVLGPVGTANGSVVILAVDNSRSKRDPWIVMERQYRHAANRYLWELPAGKIDEGEQPLEAAKRELIEETGYRARKWRPLVEYFASPGFLGESMKVFLAEGLDAGDARPEEDEEIELRLVKLSELLRMMEKGAIMDGKTLTSVLLYERQKARRGKK